MKYLLYGANGYTAQLIIKESLVKGLMPILAGRNEAKIKVIANKFDLEYRVFSLDNAEVIAQNMNDVSLCIHTAGPFVHTATQMAKGCMLANTHYLDITGEIEVFETLKQLDNEARENAVMVMPGVGFDVVPSDCLANFLKEKMPDATHLELAFASEGGALSHGTASTMVENLGEGSLVRENGNLKKVSVAHKSKRIDFGEFSRTMGTIPWGDISTAYTSTGIPNIEVYTSIPSKTIKRMKYQRFFNPILRSSLVKKMAKRYVNRNITGPTAAQNQNGRSYLHGVIRNGNKEKEAFLTCAEGYLLTALCSVHIAQKVMNGDFKIGYQTPAMVYGWQLIQEIKGSEIREIL